MHVVEVMKKDRSLQLRQAAATDMEKKKTLADIAYMEKKVRNRQQRSQWTMKKGIDEDENKNPVNAFIYNYDDQMHLSYYWQRW